MPSESLFLKCKSCGKISSKENLRCPDCGKVLKKPSILHLIGIGFISIIIYIGMSAPDGAKLEDNKTEKYIDIKSAVSKDIKLHYAWKKGGFGSVMEADLTINNDSKFDIKDVEIQCDHYAKSGTKIDSNNRDIYEVFKSNSKKRFPDFNMGFIHGQVNKSSCYIKDFKLVDK